MIKAIDNYEGLNITFNVTEDCNLRCKYCYELDKRPGDLPLEYAQRFIDIILTDPDPIMAVGTPDEWILNNGLIMDMIGGDALMRPQLVNDILTYFVYKSTILRHKWAHRWRCSISTNGTLFGEPGVKPLLERWKDNISLGISIDGCPEVHDLNRDNSMAAIMMEWDWYTEYMRGEFSTKSTLNKDSIPYLLKSMKFMHETLGIRYINMNFIFENMGDGPEDWALLDEQMEKCVDYCLQHYKDIHWAMIDQEFGIGHCMKDPLKGWCGSGAMPCLGINGAIYPCFRFMPHTMSSRDLDLRVGDVWKGFYQKENFRKVRECTREKISDKECMECSVESSCAWCIGGAYAEKGQFYRQKNICNVHKVIAKWADTYWREYERLTGSRDYQQAGCGCTPTVCPA